MTTPEQARAFVEALSERVEARLYGVRDALRLVLVGILTDSHVLIDDVPGVGKTTLVRMLAALLGLDFARVQFTPDLMPSDITGTSVLDLRSHEFEFRAGPIFAQILLADEINRATPKTQAALLEAMQERQVTVDGVTYPLPQPFFVLATQNPVELEGTVLRTLVEEVRMESPVRRYMVSLARASREHVDLQVGASPRAVEHMGDAARAWAFLAGRDYVLPDDVKDLAGPVLGHRLVLTTDARIRGRTPESVLEEVVERVPVPVEFQHETFRRVPER